MRLRSIFTTLLGSLGFAIQSIRANLLRTLLSLLGVTIGVFCIVSILTLVDSVEISIRESVSKFGDRAYFVQKWPWGFDSEYPWWKYMKRPEVTYQDMLRLEKSFDKAEAIAFGVRIAGKKITLPYKKDKIGVQEVENVSVRTMTHDLYKIQPVELLHGRYFSIQESETGAQVAILGHDLASTLFEDVEKAIGAQVDLMGRRLRVIGVIKKEGQGMGIQANDNAVLVPHNFVRSIGRFDEGQFGPVILVKAPAGVDEDKFRDDLIGAMRGVRRLRPGLEEDFAINQVTMFTAFLGKLFDQISLYGWIIAGFSILVGGFGIANIMFVSVRERTAIIGIQKALGAKRFFIQFQFLTEAVLLCIIGGLMALLLIFLLTALLNQTMPFTLVLTAKNIMVGIGISSGIGILAGFLPARQASRLDPIEAIRFSI